MKTYQAFPVKFDEKREWLFFVFRDTDWRDTDVTRFIGIPSSELDMLTDAEISQYVRKTAKLGPAIEVWRNAVDILNTQTSMLGNDLELLHQTRTRLEAFKTYHIAISDALDLINDHIESVEARFRRKAEKTKDRQYIAKNYDSIFVQIGRRDGFHCAACKTTHDLQIDHVMPLALGGDNQLSNLQLLCASCNLSKSDSEIDYRDQGGVP